MNFVHPWFLFGLTALAIPVIIHLFSFRRYKRVFFPNVRFLREVKEETRSHSRLKHLLILLMRLLAISMLVLAFAQPFIPSPNQAAKSVGPKAIHLFIDNSFSMESLGKAGNLLEESKRTATDIVRNYSASDRFQILTNDFEGKHQRYFSREEALSLIAAINSSPVSRTSAEILQRQKDLAASRKTSNVSYYLISDFQKGAYNLNELKSDTGTTLNLIPVHPEALKNVYVDSCWFKDPVRRPGKKEELSVRINNASSENLESVPVKLYINGIQKALSSVDLSAGESKDTVLTFVSENAGLQQSRIQITDHPIVFDDAYYFSYNILKTIKILVVNGNEPNPYLTSLLSSDSSFLLSSTEEKKLNYSSLHENQLVILNETEGVASGLAAELKKFIDNGGSVLLVPGMKEGANYNDFLGTFGLSYGRADTTKTRVRFILAEHPLFSGVFEKKPENVDLPEVRIHYGITAGTRSTLEPVLRLADGSAFLGMRNSGKGKLYVSSVTFSEEASSFVKHALFVPLVYNIALFSAPSSILSYTIGLDEAVIAERTVAGTEQVFRLKSDTGSFDVIPENRRSMNSSALYFHNSIRQAGNYTLYLGNEPIQGCSFNYDRKESTLEYLSDEELKGLAESNKNTHVLDLTKGTASVALKEISQGKKLWKLCIILALAFLLAEILIIKLWKNEAIVTLRPDH